MKKNPLLIKEADFLGKGSERLCFRHPEKKEFCIKVCRSHSNRKQQRHERRLFSKLDAKAKESGHLVRYFGTIPTDRGEGLLFETIVDHDGKVSKSLLHYLLHEPEKIDDAMLKALKELENFVKTHRIVLKDPSPSNLLYKRLDKTKGIFVIIDGIGSPLPDIPFFKTYTDYKVRRQFDKVVARLKKERNDPELHRKINILWK